jgi:hypothetical protein
LQEKYPIVMLIACLGVVFVIIDLCGVLSPIRRFAVTNAHQYQDFERSIPFSQLEVTDKQRYRFGNSSMVDLLLRNTGTANGYDALPIPSHVRSKNSQDYRGEFYLQNGNGQLDIISWSPNRWDVKVQIFGRDILIVNQNFDPGWRSNPPKKLLNVNGVLGVEVGPQDREIVFYYWPFNFILGLWVSLLGLIAIGWDILKNV